MDAVLEIDLDQQGTKLVAQDDALLFEHPKQRLADQRQMVQLAGEMIHLVLEVPDPTAIADHLAAQRHAGSLEILDVLALQPVVVVQAIKHGHDRSSSSSFQTLGRRRTSFMTQSGSAQY